jgi:hypothetical protein
MEIAMQRGSESRMLIDGKLVPASDGATYANIKTIAYVAG